MGGRERARRYSSCAGSDLIGFMCGNVFQSHTCEIPPHLLAISSGHNTQQREQSPQRLDSLDCSSAFIAAEEKGLAAAFRHSERCLISPSFSSTVPRFICLRFGHSVLRSTRYLFVRPLILFTSCRDFFSHAAKFAFKRYFLSIFNFSSKILFLLNSIQQVYFPICSPPRLPRSLRSRAQFSNSHLSMSAQLPSLNPFPCHSPRQGRPPVSSLGGHGERLARGSDNPLTPHLSSARGKAPS